jgi:hypothetical protein
MAESSMIVRLWNKVDRKFRESDIDGAVRSLETKLAKEPVDRFKGLVNAEFDNTSTSVLSAINRFIRACDKRFEVKAVYLEMNGFDINPDRWYFDFFGYAADGGDPRKSDWLCDFQPVPFRDVTLKGMEAIQAEFAWYHDNEIYNDKRYTRAYELSVLLVMTKFVALVQSALRSSKLAKPIPVLATAHDFDIIARFTT